MRCPNCGTEPPAEAQHCPTCGTELNPPASAVSLSDRAKRASKVVWAELNKPASQPQANAQRQEAYSRTYTGSAKDLQRQFTAESQKFAAAGYAVESQSVVQGRSGCLRLIMLGGIGAIFIRPPDRMMVTYRLVKPDPPSAPSATASQADEIRKLMELRDAGGITEDEFQVAKRKLLDGP